MLGLLTAISVAAAGVAKHLMDLNDAEMEKQKKDREIRKLQKKLEEEQRRKRELQDEVDHQRLLKNISESNTIHYIKGMGEVMDMRADLAEILSNLTCCAS